MFPAIMAHSLAQMRVMSSAPVHLSLFLLGETFHETMILSISCLLGRFDSRYGASGFFWGFFRFVAVAATEPLRFGADVDCASFVTFKSPEGLCREGIEEEVVSLASLYGVALEGGWSLSK